MRVGPNRRWRPSSTHAAAAAMLLVVSLLTASTAAQEPVASTRDVLRLIARVDRVDRLGRTLTLRAENGLVHTVYVDPKLHSSTN